MYVGPGSFPLSLTVFWMPCYSALISLAQSRGFYPLGCTDKFVTILCRQELESCLDVWGVQGRGGENVPTTYLILVNGLCTTSKNWCSFSTKMKGAFRKSVGKYNCRPQAKYRDLNRDLLSPKINFLWPSVGHRRSPFCELARNTFYTKTLPNCLAFSRLLLRTTIFLVQVSLGYSRRICCCCCCWLLFVCFLLNRNRFLNISAEKRAKHLLWAQ